MCDIIWGGCTDEAQKAETVLSAVSYIYMYVYIFTFLKVIQLMMIKAKLLEKLRTNRV